jgi:hypothetical protein
MVAPMAARRTGCAALQHRTAHGRRQAVYQHCVRAAPDLRTVGDKLADLERRVMRIEAAVERIADAVQVLVLEREGGA